MPKLKMFYAMGIILLMGCSTIPVLSPTVSPVTTEVIPTHTPIASNSVIDKCLPIEPNNPDLLSSGNLILSGAANPYNLYKINMENGERTDFSDPNTSSIDVSVSPDRKWAAYEQLSSDENGNMVDNLIVADSSGKQQKVIAWEEKWLYLSRWLDNQRLLVGVETQSATENTDYEYSTFMVLNPDTNERQLLEPNFPDIYKPILAPSWTGSGEATYNSTLDRVVYVQGGPSGNGAFHYILWDLKQHLTLANFEIVDNTLAIPRWSPDGQSFVFAKNVKTDHLQLQLNWPAYELLVVGLNGQVIQLTNLTSKYPWVIINDYSWSPDGRYVAFWFSWWSQKRPDFESQFESYPGVVDVENNVVTNYCIPGHFDIRNARWTQPLWSPDGKQLVVEDYYSEDHSRVILIDLEKQKAVQIGEDMKPEGWMIAP